MGSPNNNNRELRYFQGEVRAVNKESRTIRGYGIVFNRESHEMRMGGTKFKEVILPQAMEGVDLRMLQSMHNHDPNRLLGTTWAGTMRVGVDQIGVWYETDVPDSPTGQDTWVSVQRGDTRTSSFQFTTPEGGDTWERRDGYLLRTINKFSGIYEMGPVSNEAYPDTTVDVTVAKRSLDASGLTQEAPKTQFTTELTAVLENGETRIFQGPTIEAESMDAAAEYAQNNGMGYLRVVGPLVAEVPTSPNIEAITAEIEAILALSEH